MPETADADRDPPRRAPRASRPGCSPSGASRTPRSATSPTPPGILSGSLYHHFDSKESMVDEILLDASRTELFGQYDEILASDADAAGQARARWSGSPSRRSTSTTTRSRSSRTTRPTSARFERFGYLPSATRSSATCGSTLLERGRRSRRAARRPRRRAHLPLHPRHRLGRGPLVPPRRRADRTTEVADQYLSILLDGIARHDLTRPTSSTPSAPRSASAAARSPAMHSADLGAPRADRADATAPASTRAPSTT